MSLVRLELFREVDSLQREMNRFIENSIARSDDNRLTTSFVPAAELEETSDALHLKLEVPGMESKDLDIQVSAEAVSISGERKSENKTQEGGVTRSEFRYGSFRRVIPLPNRIQNNNVQAEYKDGILNLTLPKAEEEKNKIVKVNLD
ncbi:Hsp20/alpha crystallin family protein [Lusitaniella coriacea LEGE 07157]|uniref:Hsp20/alpha crystallin family protein n=1 Tax=Lusitaniella coriacea LEGE 07157 TaxID=945747 RepID=A0A8J7DXY6_9CYAN|nr:Hsp20/alpha crystallin family protein [Lusitaniella coriacea]MBE9117474.1 Hsp20/alpha crystallin family protein [Lusitaniella coriacea LEGE 07157]